MNRFQYLLKQIKPSENVKKAKYSQSVVEILSLMQSCIKQNIVLDVSDIPHHYIEMSLIGLSKMYNVPILVGDKEIARSLTIAFSYKKIYDIESLPQKYSSIICYNIDIKKIDRPLEIFFKVVKK